jgi:hypothetical protein
MNENPHRISDWLLSLWHYLLTDSAKYHRKDAQPASDARIDEMYGPHVFFFAVRLLLIEYLGR